MSALPEETVLDTALRVLVPDETPDDGDLDSSPWRVTDERSAEWSLMRIRVAHATARRRTEAARDLLAEYEASATALRQTIAEIKRPHDRTADHFIALLQDWHRRVLVEDPKSTTIKLGAGLLKSRAGRDKVEVDDEEAVATAAEAGQADYAAWVPKPNKVKLLAHIKATGEIPPGARLVKATEDDRAFEVVL